MQLRQFLDRASGTFSYLIACPQSGRAAMIDPVLSDAPLYLGVLDEMGWQLDYVLETHLHSDHLSAAATLRQATGARIGASREGGFTGLDDELGDGDHFLVGTLAISVLSTPGHTPACLTYRVADRLFTGDCLLIGECGRTDEPGSNAARLYDTLTRRFLPLPDETLLYPGHNREGRLVSCMGEERRQNPLFQGLARDEFIRRMTERPAPPVTPEAQQIAMRNRLQTSDQNFQALSQGKQA